MTQRRCGAKKEAKESSQLTDGGVIDEAVDALAGGEDEHAGAAVERVPSRHQVPTRLQHVLQRRRRLKKGAMLD